jgi:hypothetical protein
MKELTNQVRQTFWQDLQCPRFVEIIDSKTRSVCHFTGIYAALILGSINIFWTVYVSDTGVSWIAFCCSIGIYWYVTSYRYLGNRIDYLGNYLWIWFGLKEMLEKKINFFSGKSGLVCTKGPSVNCVTQWGTVPPVKKDAKNKTAPSSLRGGGKENYSFYPFSQILLKLWKRYFLSSVILLQLY